MVALAGSGCLSRVPAAPWRVVSASVNDTAAFARAQESVRQAFPPEYRATERAIITVRRRQFVCDGLLKVSSREGWHLAVVSTLGLVTEVRAKSDGSNEVLKVTPLFREEWAREYVAQELRYLFVPPAKLAPGGRLDDGRLVLDEVESSNGAKRRYVCRADGGVWEELEVLEGNRRRFHATISSGRSLPGWPHLSPQEIEVKADTHQLHLRLSLAPLEKGRAP
jgi:hypothetical protein